MACPTCDHTMSGLGSAWYWCPRCGTLRHALGDLSNDEAPKLVGRVRDLVSIEGTPEVSATLYDVSRRLGIFEAIFTAEKRP